MSALTQRFVMHMRLAKGGYVRGYEILDGEKIVGRKSVGAASRHEEAKVCYTLDDREFTTAKEFVAAYEAKKKAEAA
jgi:hypothetical protein